MANTKPRRERPKSKADRRKLVEINTLLNRANLTPEDRAKLEAMREELAPQKVPFAKVVPSLPAVPTGAETAQPEAGAESILLKKEPASLRYRTEKELSSREAPPSGSILPGAPPSSGILAPRTPEELEAYIKKMSDRLTEEMHSDPVRRRRCAAHHIALTTENPLRTYANTFGNDPSSLIWDKIISDRSSEIPGVNEWLADIFDEVDRRFAADENWFRRAYADGTAFKADAPAVFPVAKPEEPAPHPLAAINADLDSRAALILKTDAWLSRLAEHSDAMHNRIIVALGEEVRRTGGSVSAEFCTRLYNQSRPKEISAFPERKF